MSLPEANVPPCTSSEGLDDLFTDSQVILTVPEASKQLRIPQSTLYRHIKAGKYRTVRASDNVLRISIPTGSQSLVEAVVCEDEESGMATAILTDSQRDSEVRELRTKLEAATYRVGYLEAKLEEREREIQLLTDSQHKTKWWHKVRSWFAGQ